MIIHLSMDKVIEIIPKKALPNRTTLSNETPEPKFESTDMETLMKFVQIADNMRN